jgi:hypothetical protein
MKGDNMSKILVLKPRLKDPDGIYTWHDKYILGNALANIAKGKDLMKLSTWISVAGKIEAVAVEKELGIKLDGDTQNLIDIQVKIKNQEASLLWKELISLPFDSFGSPLVCKKCGGGVSNVPDVGTLYQMLHDIADCLGEKMPEGEDDDKDDIISDEE